VQRSKEAKKYSKIMTFARSLVMIPRHNFANCLRETLASVLVQDSGTEVIHSVEINKTNIFVL
jgi:hypothetical protein